MNSSKPVLLVVDNDVEDLELFAYASRKAEVSFDIQEVRSAKALLEFIGTHEEHPKSDGERFPSLVLLDLNMPDGKGLDALKEIRASPRVNSLPVVIFSSSQWNQEISDCYANGANAYLRKPNSLKGFIKLVKAIDHFWFELAKLPVAR